MPDDREISEWRPGGPDTDALLENIRRLMKEREGLVYSPPLGKDPMEIYHEIRLIDDKLNVRWAALDEHLSQRGQPPSAWMI